MNSSRNDAFLEGKKALVEAYVEEVTETLELDKPPKIEFCPGYTPMGQEALACIDVVLKIVYISIIHLRTMSFEEIKKNVAHELVHLIETEHTPEFYRILNNLLQGSWKPTFTSGLVMIDGNKKIEISKESKKKIDKTQCNYHQCKNKSKLKRCIHCRGYFCEEHYKPSPPIFPNFDYPRKHIEWELSKKEKTHPCPNYYNYLLRKKKEFIIKYEDSMNSMGNWVKYYRSSVEYKQKNKPVLGSTRTINSDKTSSKWKFILIVLSIIAFVTVLLLIKNILGV